jgi:epoxyqueuosine reductase
MPSAETIKQLAHECGFELAGVARALPAADFTRYQGWLAAGMAGEMSYLTDHRGAMRADPRQLLPSARAIICVGKVYNVPYPYSTRFNQEDCAWISRYAWGDDYHDVIRSGLENFVRCLEGHVKIPFEWRICVDTAPLLERSYARLAGLGWIGRNTCLINQQHGSWVFLGEVLVSLDLAADTTVPDRCGTCRRCIDSCPTEALVPRATGGWQLDSRLCISYLTIEKRGSVPIERQAELGNQVFGCDICQDVCPWNRKAPATADAAFQPRSFAPRLADLAGMSEGEFRRLFRNTPVWRTKYRGFLRNVAIAMGNAVREDFRIPLEKLAANPDPVVSEAARASLLRLSSREQISQPS